MSINAPTENTAGSVVALIHLSDERRAVLYYQSYVRYSPRSHMDQSSFGREPSRLDFFTQSKTSKPIHADRTHIPQTVGFLGVTSGFRYEIRKLFRKPDGVQYILKGLGSIIGDRPRIMSVTNRAEAGARSNPLR